MKFCSKCKVEKPLEEFCKRRGSHDGLARFCNPCNNAYHRLYHQERSPEQKLKRANCCRKWREKNPDRQRCDHLKGYGLTEASFAAILLAQNNRCAICGRVLTVTSAGKSVHKEAHIDHCHSTGRVRGILCRRCNTALGNFQDSEEVLTSAIEYLRKTKQEKTKRQKQKKENKNGSIIR